MHILTQLVFSGIALRMIYAVIAFGQPGRWRNPMKIGRDRMAGRDRHRNIIALGPHLARISWQTSSRSHAHYSIVSRRWLT